MGGLVSRRADAGPGRGAGSSLAAADEPALLELVLVCDCLAAADVASAACVSRAWRRAASAVGWRALWRRQAGGLLRMEAVLAARPDGFRAALAQLRAAELAARGASPWTSLADFQLVADVTWRGRPLAAVVTELSTLTLQDPDKAYASFVEGVSTLPADSEAARDFARTRVAHLPHGLPDELKEQLRLRLLVVRRDGALAQLPLNSVGSKMIVVDKRSHPPSRHNSSEFVHLPATWRWRALDARGCPFGFYKDAGSAELTGVSFDVELVQANFDYDTGAGAVRGCRVDLYVGDERIAIPEALYPDELLGALKQSLCWVPRADAEATCAALLGRAAPVHR